MFATVKFHGILAEEFTSEFQCELRTPRDVIGLMECNYPGFSKRIWDLSESGYAYQVIAGDRELGEAELDFPLTAEELQITPVLAGSGKLGKLILGVGLLATGAFGVGLFGFSAFQTAFLGGLLAIKGFQGMFNHPKPSNEQQSNQRSTLFNGAVNTTGVDMIPIVMGINKTGSIVVSYQSISYGL